MSPSVAGKRVLVTGGADGIGRGIALAFARQGATVVAADLKPLSLSDLGAHDAKSSGQAGTPGYITTILCDAGDPSQVADAVARAAVAMGGVTTLVNNCAAPVGELAPCHLLSDDDWDRQISVNLGSYFHFSKRCIPHMLDAMATATNDAHAGCSIINISSVNAVQHQFGTPAYAASKAGILGLTRQISIDYGGTGIRCNAVNPGSIKTPRFLNLVASTSDLATAGANYPLRRVGEVGEVASVVLFLASDAAGFITGEDVNVDGGILVEGNWASAEGKPWWDTTQD